VIARATPALLDVFSLVGHAPNDYSARALTGETLIASSIVSSTGSDARIAITYAVASGRKKLPASPRSPEASRASYIHGHLTSQPAAAGAKGARSPADEAE
jgi:hypothetical protein